MGSVLNPVAGCGPAKNWEEVTKLFVDTIIPKYNSGFYEKLGFKPIGDGYCEFLGHKIKALRLAKKIKK